MGAVIGARAHYLLRPHSLWVGAVAAFALARRAVCAAVFCGQGSYSGLSDSL